MPDTLFPYDDETTDPYSADDTKNPHDDEPLDETLSGDEAPAPVKRGPGRPRKTAG